MDGLFSKNSHILEPGEILSGIARQAQTLHIASGFAWITIEGRPDDHWLFGGDTLTVPPNRLIVIEAEKCTSRVHVQQATGQNASINPLTRISKEEPARSAACTGQC